MNRGKKQLIVGYAVFSLFFFIFIFGFWLFQVEGIKIDNRKNCRDSLLDINKKISSTYISTHNLKGAKLHSIFEQGFKQNPRFVNLLIYSKEYGIIYADGKERSFIITQMPENGSLPPDWKGKPEYALPSGVELIGEEINIKNNSERILFLDGIFVIFGSADYSKLLWIVLFILIGFFIFTLTIIISVSVLSRSLTQRQAIPITKPDTSLKDNVKADKPDKNYFSPQGRQLSEVEASIEKLKNQEQFPPSAQQHRELFSPHTGLGFHEHLEQRLKFELERAASFDQDLVLALIKIYNNTQTQLDKLRIEIAKAILNYFPFQDLAFEFTKSAFAIIIPESDIDSALKNMDIFRKYIKEKKITLAIGLSSRNGRLLSAKLLLNEAKHSLKKAIAQGENKIIAFRADPNKYRDILSP